MSSKNNAEPLRQRKYIIALNKWHSRLAMIAGFVTVICSLYAIGGSIALYAENRANVGELFHWFTTNANCLTAFAACMIIPYALDGIRRKHFSCPQWVARLHYSGMVCTTLTMVFSLVFISRVDPQIAFGGYNTYLHIVCPVLVFVSFFLVESGRRYSLKDALFACIPATLYAAIYLAEVCIIGKKNGGWEDLYHILDHMSPWLALPAGALLTVCISLLIRFLYNRLTASRQKRMDARLWPPDVNPVEINIEMFGLGRYMGKHTDREFAELPLSLISRISDRYSLKTEDLIRPYVKGFLDAAKEKKEL